MSDAREALVALLWEKFGAWPNGPLAAWLTEADCARFAAAILTEFDVTPPGGRVKPSVEDVARQIDPEAFDFPEECAGDVEVATDAAARVLALLPGRAESEVKAEGWDEGARAGLDAGLSIAEKVYANGGTLNLAFIPNAPVNPYREKADRG